MKRIICFVLTLILLFSFAAAESVTQRSYELVVDGQSRLGKYTGDMVNGVPEGYGIFATTNPNGFSWHYVGYWKNGLMDGQGGTYWEDGSLEIGEYEEGHFVFGYYNYDGVDFELFSPDPTRSLTEEDPGSNAGDVPDLSESSASVPDAVPQEVQYIGNQNSHVFHRCDCDSVRDMKEKNKIEFYTREEAVELGYKPCQRCNP